jgi:Zn-dependent M28 family amino/carboxypeptidase
VATFKSFGAEVIEQNFEAKAYTGEVLKGTNVIAQYNPAAQRRVLLSAHWDTRHIADHDPDPANHKTPILGADDGGSGVGVLLEIARNLQAKNPDLGVDIILWDAEDYGNDNGNDEFSWCLGSQYWARNPHKPGYRAMYGINLDMVGAANARFGREGVSMQFASSTVDLVWSTANNLGYNGYFVSDAVPGITDDHRFVNEIARIPTIDIINRPADANGGFVKHWHTVKDDMSAIDANTLKAVGQTVMAVIYREGAGVL